MTVRQLIEKLQEMPQDMRVFVNCGKNELANECPVFSVEIERIDHVQADGCYDACDMDVVNIVGRGCFVADLLGK